MTKLTAGNIEQDFTLGTGHVLFNTGSYEFVLGANFGASSDLVMWYGPSQTAISGCSKSNAKFYLDNAGDAYFGGSLLAGVLQNGVQTSASASGAVATLGPFNSDGNPIVVTYGASGANTVSCPGTAAGLSSYNAALAAYVQPTGTIVLKESLNGAPTTTKATISISGPKTPGSLAPIPADSEPGHITYTISGSGTYTTSGSSTVAEPHIYTLTLTALAGSYPDPFNLSINSVEQPS